MNLIKFILWNLINIQFDWNRQTFGEERKNTKENKQHMRKIQLKFWSSFERNKKRLNIWYHKCAKKNGFCLIKNESIFEQWD